MKHQPFQSRAVASAGYDAATRRLEVWFTSGRRYEFFDVPPSVYEWFVRAKSKGTFVTRLINDKYRYREITESPEPEDLEAALRASLEGLQKPLADA